MQLSIAVEENVCVCARVCVCGFIVREGLLFFLNIVCLLHYGRKHSEWIFQAVVSATYEIQDKPLTQAFHLEADNIPDTFPAMQSTGMQQRMGNKTGSPLHSLHMPKNATVTA